MTPKRFALCYLKLRRTSRQVCDVDGTEYRVLPNGVMLQFQHYRRIIQVKFPRHPWTDYDAVRKAIPPSLVVCKPLDGFMAEVESGG